MIKVNLLNDRSLKKNEEIANVGKMSYADVLKMGRSRSSGGGFANDDEVPMIYKVAAIALPVVLLFLYEKKATSDANKIMSQLTVDMQNVEEIKRQKEEIIAATKNTSLELEASRAVLKELQNIDYFRLMAIRALDNLQDIMPYQVWLQSVDMDRNSINIDGVAVSDNDLTQFQQNLEQSIYFKDILIYNSMELKAGGGKYVGFKLRANLGDLSGG